MQADRRRINPPAGGTSSPKFVITPKNGLKRPVRDRQLEEHRKIFLRTGIVPTASGSAYYEIPPQESQKGNGFIIPSSSSIKITCTVHGPRPLPRNAAFSSNLLLSTHIKFAPFAARVRRGYVRDSSERDLGVHLETALRGVVIGERWPKSGCEVVITVLEGEEDGWPAGGQGRGSSNGWGMMNVLAGCITVASAALVDAGIDCVDLISGGVAAITTSSPTDGTPPQVTLDPAPSEQDITAACVVGYMQSRDEINEVWLKGNAGHQTETLIDGAVKAATMTRTVLAEAIKEAMEQKLKAQAELDSAVTETTNPKGKDIEMTG